MSSTESDPVYEDDFDTSETNKLRSENSPPLGKSKKPPSYKPPLKNQTPKNTYNRKLSPYGSIDAHSNDLPLAKKSRQALEKENAQLRNDLKKLNDRISSLLESKSKSSQVKNKHEKKSPRVNPNGLHKKLQYYELEYLRVKQVYQKFNDTECLLNMNSEVRLKKKKIEELEKELKKIKFSIDHKQRDIDNFEDCELPEDKLNHKQLTNENIKVIEQINLIEKNIEKVTEKQQETRRNEEELKEKFEKISSVASNCLVEAEDTKTKDLYESSKRTLENLLKVSQVSLTQLRIKEHDLKNADSLFEQELKKYQILLKEKDDILSQVRNELDNVNNLPSTSKLDKLASMLKSFSRTGSVVRSVSPRSGLNMVVKSGSGSKEQLKNSLSKEALKSDKAQGPIKGSQAKDSGFNLRENESLSEKLEENKEEDSRSILEEINQVKENIKEIEKELNKERAAELDKEKKTQRDSVKDYITGKNSSLKNEIFSPDFEKGKHDFTKPDAKKEGLFETLEKKEEKKRGFFEELEGKHKGTRNFLNDLEDKDKNSGFFQLLESNNKDRENLFSKAEFKKEDILEEIGRMKPAKKVEENYDYSEIEDLTEKQGDFDDNHKVVSKTRNSMEGENKKIDVVDSDVNIFGSIQYGNPKEKRNRDHLFKNN